MVASPVAHSGRCVRPLLSSYSADTRLSAADRWRRDRLVDRRSRRQNNGPMSRELQPRNRARLASTVPALIRIGSRSIGARLHYLDEGPADCARSSAADAALRSRQSDLVVPLADADRTVAIALSLRGARSLGLRPERQAESLAAARGSHRQSGVARRSGSICSDVTLVAQDWGGAIGLGAMLRMPERLRADRALQHRRVPAALHPLADSRLPHPAARPAGCARRRTLSAAPRCA